MLRSIRWGEPIPFYLKGKLNAKWFYIQKTSFQKIEDKKAGLHLQTGFGSKSLDKQVFYCPAIAELEEIAETLNQPTPFMSEFGFELTMLVRMLAAGVANKPLLVN